MTWSRPLFAAGCLSLGACMGLVDADSPAGAGDPGSLPPLDMRRQSAKHDRRMRIVPASMHDIVTPTTVIDRLDVLYRQCVDVRPQADDGNVVAACGFEIGNHATPSR